MKEIKQYTEKHFLLHRDLTAYAQKQAQSCLFLVDLLNKFSTRNFDIWDRLVRVHRRQYNEIGLIVDRPKGSFYFEYMYSNVEQSTDECKKIAIHCVSYGRGIDRYREICKSMNIDWDIASDRIWATLYCDAVSNYQLCYDALSNYYGYKGVLNYVIRVEKTLMKMIDEDKVG